MNPAFKIALKNLAAADQTASERKRTILDSVSRRVSDDYTKRAYALSDTHFGQKPMDKRESINSSETIEMVSDDENDIDELYRGNSEEEKSFDGEMSPRGTQLRLSTKQLRVPRMNPNSYDSDNHMKIFSREQDNYLQGIGSKTGLEGDEFRMTGREDALDG